MNKDTGGPAFPIDIPSVGHSTGMTLRDYFAAKAMQGMLAACTGWGHGQEKRLANCSYEIADEMLKARES